MPHLSLSGAGVSWTSPGGPGGRDGHPRDGGDCRCRGHAAAGRMDADRSFGRLLRRFGGNERTVPLVARSSGNSHGPIAGSVGRIGARGALGALGAIGVFLTGHRSLRATGSCGPRLAAESTLGRVPTSRVAGPSRVRVTRRGSTGPHPRRFPHPGVSSPDGAAPALPRMDADLPLLGIQAPGLGPAAGGPCSPVGSAARGRRHRAGHQRHLMGDDRHDGAPRANPAGSPGSAARGALDRSRCRSQCVHPIAGRLVQPVHPLHRGHASERVGHRVGEGRSVQGRVAARRHPLRRIGLPASCPGGGGGRGSGRAEAVTGVDPLTHPLGACGVSARLSRPNRLTTPSRLADAKSCQSRHQGLRFNP